MQEQVQNAPELELVPQENLMSDFKLEELKPFVGAELTVDRLEFVEGRGNVIINYVPQSSRATDKTQALVGTHMDVVLANPECW